MLDSLMDYLVDDRVGVLGAVTEVRSQPGAPEFFHFVANLCNTQAFSEYHNSGFRGAAAEDRETAVTQVTLDALAGYCSALISEEDGKYPICSARTAPLRCTPPSDFALFSREQYALPGFPWVPFNDDTPIQWSEALDPLADETVLIPSAVRFLPYSALVGHGEALVSPATSTGLACHWDPATAAAEAICDVIECDAAALLWQARITPPQIRVETLSDRNYDLVSRFERTGGSITLLKVDLDLGIPIIVAVLSNHRSTAPARVFAAGTSLDPEQAIRKSLRMLAHVQQYCQLVWTQLPRVSDDPGAMVEQADHLNYWCDHRHASGADFLLASNQRLEFDEIENLSTGGPAKDLMNLLKRVQRTGYRTVLANLTTPDIAGLGLTVVRAIVPGLQPLFYGFHGRALGGDRLWHLPQKLGYKGVNATSGDNPLPHPFPRKGMA